MKNDNMQEYSLPFAAWELRLYLDTHPDDAEAFAKYKAICASMGNKCNYACHTTSPRSTVNEGGCGCSTNTCGNGNCSSGSGNCSSGSCGGGNYGGRRNDGGNYSRCSCERNGCGADDEPYNVWSWIEGPWPWEPEANNGGGNC